MKQAYTNATIVDVRSPEEFSSEHISSAINIPIDQIAYHIRELKTLRRPIVTYCWSGNRSSMAVQLLKKIGIEEAINAGGLNEIKQDLKR